MNSFKTRLISLRWPSFLGGWAIVLIAASPFIFILTTMFAVNSSLVELNGLIDWNSVFTTILLILSVALVALLLGTIPAFFITHYQFPLSHFFSRALILPLAIPGYVMAVIYSGIFDFGGEWQKFNAFVFGGSWIQYEVINIRNFFGLVMVLALALFPYVFITSRSAFTQRSARIEESALSLGISRRKTIWKIILPLALPGIFAGAGLVMMETLNDYGASAYYGIRTVTMEIFRCWNADLYHAMYFSAWVLIIPFTLLYLRNHSAKKRGAVKADHSVPQLRKIKGVQAIIVILICAIPFLFGILIPFSMLLKWTFANTHVLNNSSFTALLVNSFQLAAIAAAITVVLALLVNHFFTMNRYHRAPVLTRAGYMMPGAILAIGILSITTFIDNATGFSYANLLTGSLAVLIIAYVIRFLSVSLDPLQSVYQIKGKNLSDSALSMGTRPWKIVTRISLPVFAPVLLATFILVFIDILKELPLTLLLRPFNFETLSTSVFQYAHVNESVQQAAPAALIIVLLGMIPVLLLHRYLQHGKSA
ncbi:MAG: ABC transporter permease [Flavobacteriales bacterium]